MLRGEERRRISGEGGPAALGPGRAHPRALLPEVRLHYLRPALPRLAQALEGEEGEEEEEGGRRSVKEEQVLEVQEMVLEVLEM